MANIIPLQLPSESIRISRGQLEILAADVHPLFFSMLTLKNTNVGLYVAPSDYDLDMFVTFQTRLERLSSRLSASYSDSQQSRFRVKLDLFEVSLSVAGMRAARRTKSEPARLGSAIPNVGKAKQRRSELLRRLENCERRLRRRVDRQPVQSRDKILLLQHLARYRKLVVHELFYCDKPTPSPLAYLKRQMYETLVGFAKDGLTKGGIELPPEKELRALVRLFLQQVRCYKSSVTYLQLLGDESLGKVPLLEFIKAKLDSKRRTEYCKRISDLSERLDKFDPPVE